MPSSKTCLSANTGPLPWNTHFRLCFKLVLFGGGRRFHVWLEPTRRACEGHRALKVKGYKKALSAHTKPEQSLHMDQVRIIVLPFSPFPNDFRATDMVDIFCYFNGISYRYTSGYFEMRGAYTRVFFLFIIVPGELNTCENG